MAVAIMMLMLTLLLVLLLVLVLVVMLVVTITDIVVTPVTIERRDESFAGEPPRQTQAALREVAEDATFDLPLSRGAAPVEDHRHV